MRVSFLILVILVFSVSGCSALKSDRQAALQPPVEPPMYLDSAEQRQIALDKFLKREPPYKERDKIRYLLSRVSNSPLEFIRNGETYNGKQASLWVRWKMFHPQYFKDPIDTADEFVKRVCRGSVSSGRLYEVILADGRREKLKTVLSQELDSLNEVIQLRMPILPVPEPPLGVVDPNMRNPEIAFRPAVVAGEQ